MEQPTIHPEQLQEAAENLTTIRDFIRFGVTALRQYDAHLGQGTEDYFAESSALVLQTLSLEWAADAEILDAKLLPSEKAEFLSLLERRVNERIPTSYLLNLAYFANKPFYVDERVLIPRSPIAELIEQRFAPYCLDEHGNMLQNLEDLEKIGHGEKVNAYRSLDLDRGCPRGACRLGSGDARRRRDRHGPGAGGIAHRPDRARSDAAGDQRLRDVPAAAGRRCRGTATSSPAPRTGPRRSPSSRTAAAR